MFAENEWAGIRYGAIVEWDDVEVGLGQDVKGIEGLLKPRSRACDLRAAARGTHVMARSYCCDQTVNVVFPKEHEHPPYECLSMYPYEANEILEDETVITYIRPS